MWIRMPSELESPDVMGANEAKAARAAISPKFVAATRKRLTAAQLKFLDWLKRYNPDVYAVAMSEAQSGGNNELGALGQPWALPELTAPATATAGAGWEGLATSLTNVLPALVTGYTQIELYKAQMKRAEKGLPPLPTESIAPTVRVQAEVSQDLMNNIQKMVVPIGIGIGILFLMSRK